MKVSDEPSYWPDGTLKHRWVSSRRFRSRLCAWCSQTQGDASVGRACRSTFRPDVATYRTPTTGVADGRAARTGRD